MANDLQTMFEQLGPGAGAVEMAAQNMAADKDAASQQAYRQAQMADIMQRTAAAKDMAPLELEAKRTSNDVSKLKAAADRADYRSELVGRMIPLVENAPPAARLALMKQYAEENGLPMDESHLQHFAKIPADKLPEYLRTQRDNDIKNSEKYRQAWDTAEMQRKSAENIAAGHDAATRYGVDTRAQLAKDRAAASASDTAMMTKLVGNYAGQQAYYEKKARDAYNAGDDSQYLYYTNLRDKAKQQELDKASAGQNARANADTARLEALGGGSVIVKPPANLSISQKRDAL